MFWGLPCAERRAAAAQRLCLKPRPTPRIAQTPSQCTMSEDVHQKGSAQGKGLRTLDPHTSGKCLIPPGKGDACWGHTLYFNYTIGC